MYRENDFYKKIAGIDRDAHNLVGVHIRRGDYRTWKNGEYYFTDEVYRMYMDKLERELSLVTDKKTVFLIFSNEDVFLESSDRVLISKNAWYVDQQVMSLCDFLIGPPSTFTLWASFLGQTRFFHIPDDSGELSLRDFQRCLG